MYAVSDPRDRKRRKGVPTEDMDMDIEPVQAIDKSIGFSIAKTLKLLRSHLWS